VARSCSAVTTVKGVGEFAASEITREPVTTTDSTGPSTGLGELAGGVGAVWAFAELPLRKPNSSAKTDVDCLNDDDISRTSFFVSGREIVTIPSAERLTFRSVLFSIRSRATETS